MPLINPVRASRRLRARRAFTLIELLIVMVLLSIVGAALMRIIVRQSGFFRSSGDLLDLRSQLRQASAAMASDLRGIDPAKGDIIAMTDSSIDFRQTFGSAVICKINSSTEVVLPPKSLTSGVVLTSWLQQPANGDSALVLDEGASNAAKDDTWDSTQVSAATSALNTCPTGTGYLTAAGDALSNSYVVDLSSALNANVKVGAPIRFFRDAHYSLYHSTSDHNWYLGFCTPNCATQAIQPIAGPFLADSGGTSGLTFTYYDSTGTATTNRAAVYGIRIVLRGQTRTPVTISGMQRHYVQDSIRLNVAIRNR